MKIKISESEKMILSHFRKMKYPNIYKTDNTDNILFVEMVDFDVCDILLAGKNINLDVYNHIMNNYHNYLKQIDLKNFDEYAQVHYNKIVQIMEIFTKYYGN